MENSFKKLSKAIITTCLTMLCLPFLSFGQQTINASIIHDGLTRDYILYVPATYTVGTAAPLVFNFHGFGSNTSQQIAYGDFRPIADTAGFLLVVPQGTIDGSGYTHFNVGWGNSSVDDVGFTAALIDSISAEYSIDQDRIYSTGMSNGGFMSYVLACELSNRIAAIASVTGSMNIGYSATCNPAHAMPIMEVHGTADNTIMFTGDWYEAIDNVVSFWVNFNNADTPALLNNVPDISTADNCTAEHQLFANGDNGVEIELYKIIGGEHTWPGSFFGGSGTNQDINASVEIWKFFAKYDINGSIATPPPITSLDENNTPGKIILYPNPATDVVIISNSLHDYSQVEIFNSVGKLVKQGGHDRDIDIGHLNSGVYLLRVIKEDGSALTAKFVKKVR